MHRNDLRAQDEDEDEDIRMERRERLGGGFIYHRIGR